MGLRSNKKVGLVNVTVLVFLMVGVLWFTAKVADARFFDPSSFLTKVMTNGDIVDTNKRLPKSSKSSSSSSSSSACCDACACTFSIPHQCQCFDIKETCHSNCKNCICALSEPPQCRCYDILDFCYESCSSSYAN